MLRVICSWHDSCYVSYVMTEHEYEKLRKERDSLVELQKSARHPKHVVMIEEQLTNIRQQLKEAHHERYKQTGQH